MGIDLSVQGTITVPYSGNKRFGLPDFFLRIIRTGIKPLFLLHTARPPTADFPARETHGVSNPELRD